MIMGSEYIFYPAFRRKEDGKYIPLLYNTDGKPADVFWRSKSFIDGNFFTENLVLLLISLSSHFKTASLFFLI